MTLLLKVRTILNVTSYDSVSKIEDDVIDMYPRARNGVSRGHF